MYPVVMNESTESVTNYYVALFFSIFDKHTENQSLIGECIYTDGHREDFLFLLSDHKSIQR